MKWDFGPRNCPSYGQYADSDCGRWRITVSTNPDGFALLDRMADYATAYVGTKDEAKRQAEALSGNDRKQ